MHWPIGRSRSCCSEAFAWLIDIWQSLWTNGLFMRQVVLDTETTGLEPAQGHRIIEIGCVELISRRQTGSHYHQYLQPDREIDPGAMEVHGITHEFLSDKPRFSDVVDEFLEFVKGAELIIHNAPFDMGFIHNELKLIQRSWEEDADGCTVSDTLLLARNLHPGQKNNLDALCKRYHIDNSQRSLHGALLDAEILADVYLAMTGGQSTLSLGGDQQDASQGHAEIHRLSSERQALKVIRATQEELQYHQQRLVDIDAASGGACLWKRLDS